MVSTGFWAIKNPAIADGVVRVRFCREMDSDNHNAPCFSLAGFVLLSAVRHQASRQRRCQQRESWMDIHSLARDPFMLVSFVPLSSGCRL